MRATRCVRLFSRHFLPILILVFMTRSLAAQHARPDLDLAGAWSFRIDPDDTGLREGWHAGGAFADTIRLPGSLQAQGFGEVPSINTRWSSGIGANLMRDDRFMPYVDREDFISPIFLTPARQYVGPAWYARDFAVPEGWTGRAVELVLERPHWTTTVWIDGEEIGSRDGIGVPHRYQLPEGIEPGTHRVVIRVDNRLSIPIGRDAHAVSDQTQTNWNGVVGDLRLIALNDACSVDSIRITPDVRERTLDLRIGLRGGAAMRPGWGFEFAVLDAVGAIVQSDLIETRTLTTGSYAATVRLPETVQRWDEFNPAVYALRVRVLDGAGEVRDEMTETFGLREIAADGTSILVNGRKTVMRGALDCAIFPDTGYPPTDVASWEEILRSVKDFGLNHVRFHSWCPPEAAFVAADRLGVYLQPEISTWPGFQDGDGLEQWLAAEGDRMLDEYGNHPSFALLCVGNEMWDNGKRLVTGSTKVEPLVRDWRERDPRRLYSVAAGWPTADASDYHIPQDIRLQLYPGLRLADRPRNDIDYRAFVDGFDRPIISHEIGQWTATPDPKHADDYTGFLRAEYHTIMADMLARSGLSELTDDFVAATGAFQMLLYKAEIEAAMRTPGIGGYQLLGLQDFTGQGVAPVGVLDAFWKPKPYASAAAYTRFAGPTVLLSRMDSFIFHSDDTLKVQLDLAHYGPEPVDDVCEYEIVTTSGARIASGRFDVKIDEAGVFELGSVEAPLSGITTPTAARVIARLRTAGIHNDWTIWVYPESTRPEPDAGKVLVVRSLTEAAIERLREGGRVALLAEPERIAGETFGTFKPIFWNRITFASQREHGVGLLNDSDHPALAAFPTARHQDFQWWDIMRDSKPIPMGFTASPIEPIVRVVDDWFQGRSLALAFECAVPIDAAAPPGRLLVCSADLHEDLANRPAARQLRSSLLAYAASNAFDPSVQVPVWELRKAFREPSAMQAAGVEITASSAAKAHGPALAVDGLTNTFWHTPWSPETIQPPHALKIDLGRQRRVSGLVYTPRQDMPNGRIGDWLIEVSEAGYAWRTIAEGTWPNSRAVQRVAWEPTEARFIRLTMNRAANDAPYASAAEIEVEFAAE